MKKSFRSYAYWGLCGLLLSTILIVSKVSNLHGTIPSEEIEGLFVLEYTGKIDDEAIDNFIAEKKALDERVKKREEEENRRKEEERKALPEYSKIYATTQKQTFGDASWICSSCYVSNKGSSTNCIGCGSSR